MPERGRHLQLSWEYICNVIDAADEIRASGDDPINLEQLTWDLHDVAKGLKGHVEDLESDLASADSILRDWPDERGMEEALYRQWEANQ